MLLKILLIAIFAAVTFTITEACQGGAPGPADAPLVRPAPKPQDFEDAIKQCLKTKGVKDDAVKGVEQADLQCIVKYAWTQPDCSAKPFLKKATEYKDVFGFNEPQRSKIKIDPSCTKGQNGTKGYFLTLWFCLEHCESVCKGGSGANYPISAVSCEYKGGKGCDEAHLCTCKLNNNECGEAKQINFGEMLEAYKDTCLNCKENRRSNPDDPLKVCVKGTEPSTFMKTPKKAFATYITYYNKNKA